MLPTRPCVTRLMPATLLALRCVVTARGRIALGVPPMLSSKLTPHADELVRLYAAGSSLRAIAKRYGVAHETVRHLLCIRGVPRRPSSCGVYPSRRGPLAANWKGGRTLDTKGYLRLLMPGHHLADNAGYVREHRLLGEQLVGRRLVAGEVVHHKNADITDNRLENLQVLTKGQHSSLHVKRGDMVGFRGCPTAEPEDLADA